MVLHIDSHAPLVSRFIFFKKNEKQTNLIGPDGFEQATETETETETGAESPICCVHTRAAAGEERTRHLLPPSFPCRTFLLLLLLLIAVLFLFYSFLLALLFIISAPPPLFPPSSSLRAGRRPTPIPSARETHQLEIGYVGAAS